MLMAALLFQLDSVLHPAEESPYPAVILHMGVRLDLQGVLCVLCVFSILCVVVVVFSVLSAFFLSSAGVRRMFLTPVA